MDEEVRHEFMKRSHSSSSAHSFVTAEDRSEDGDKPTSLIRRVSPPPTRRKPTDQVVSIPKSDHAKVSTAAVEAGEVTVDDHVAFFSSKLLAAQQPIQPGQPRLDHARWLELYDRNLNDHGHHFIVHQHDHPVAGTHYDLRLQCNATSSISFAIMYGLPGDPNSRRLNRNATETRVHNLWNHLIETASPETGTMLLWDSGEYEVLPYYSEDNEGSGSEEDTGPNTALNAMSEPQKLASAFSRRKIRLRLHGTRLPPGYTIALRLTKDNFRSSQPLPPSRRRKRKQVIHANNTASNTDSAASDSSTVQDSSNRKKIKQNVSTLSRVASPPPSKRGGELNALNSEDETEQIRLSNAYPGATNNVGSIHQRKWYLSLDRPTSGFIPIRTPKEIKGHHSKTWWIRRGADGALSQEGFERFHVLGREFERSVVTGRLAQEILNDEGVDSYVPRGKWRAVVE